MNHWQWAYAMKLWELGFDTHEIAREFKVPESLIYNGMSRRRELARNMRINECRSGASR